jgi:RHS repeat-associated protein
MDASCYQSHRGALNTSTKLNVQYTYDTTTTGSIYSNQLRLQTEVHPNSRAIYYDYGSSGSSTAAYNATSTVREIWDGSPSGTGLAVYDYNGAGSRLTISAYPQPSFKLDHFEGTSGTYAGLDRFGRVVDQYWKGSGSTADVDRIRYAYDYAGNRTYRQIDPAIYSTENMDQGYTYDGLHRLLTSQVGTLSGATISGTPASEEDWSLDGIGNWRSYVQKAGGTVSLNQSRSASSANEISAISASVGTTWATPAYDLAGNMTSIPIPTSLASVYTATYDAWNRLVSLATGSTMVATYAYDGLSRRVVKGIYVSGTLDHNEHAYFNEVWQVLEVRKEVAGVTNTNALEQYVWHQFYIDAPILRDYDATTTGSPTRYYYTCDANFNITATISTTGVPVERYYYSPYGDLTFLDGSFTILATQQSGVANPLTYTGRCFDAESGLYCVRLRMLHSQLGCFLSRDPLGFLGGLNEYAYLSDSPLNGTDPMGLRRRVMVWWLLHPYIEITLSNGRTIYLEFSPTPDNPGGYNILAEYPWGYKEPCLWFGGNLLDTTDAEDERLIDLWRVLGSDEARQERLSPFGYSPLKWNPGYNCWLPVGAYHNHGIKPRPQPKPEFCNPTIPWSE